VAALYATAIFNSVIFCLIPPQLPFSLGSLGVSAPSLVGLTIGLFNLSVVAASLGYGRIRNRIGVPGTFDLGFGYAATFRDMGLLLTGAALVAGLLVAKSPFLSRPAGE